MNDISITEDIFIGLNVLTILLSFSLPSLRVARTIFISMKKSFTFFYTKSYYCFILSINTC